MAKFILWAINLPIVAFLVAAGIGVPVSRHDRIAYMPLEIRYHIIVNKNIWPDWFYSDAYSSPEVRSFHLDTYWTFEPSKYPLSRPNWVYHPFELTMTDVDIVVEQITR